MKKKRILSFIVVFMVANAFLFILALSLWNAQNFKARNINLAMYWTGKIQGNIKSKNIDNDVYMTLRSIIEAGSFLEAQGFSEDLVREIIINGCLKKAEGLIKEARLRKSEKDVSYEIVYAHSLAHIAGKKLTDLGLSKKETKEILNEGYMAAANRWIKEAMQNRSKREVTFELNKARKYARKAGLRII